MNKVTNLQKNNLALLISTIITLLLACTFITPTNQNASPATSTNENTISNIPELIASTKEVSVISHKVIIEATADSYFVLINPSDSRDKNFLESIVEDLCSTKRFCRIHFFNSKDMAFDKSVAAYDETTITKKPFIYLFTQESTPTAPSLVAPHQYTVEQSVTRVYFFVLVDPNLVIASRDEIYTLGRFLCQNHKIYCYVFVWDDETKVSNTTLMTLEQASALKSVYSLKYGYEDIDICKPDFCSVRYSIEPQTEYSYNYPWINP